MIEYVYTKYLTLDGGYQYTRYAEDDFKYLLRDKDMGDVKWISCEQLFITEGRLNWFTFPRLHLGITEEVITSYEFEKMLISLELAK